MEETFVNYHGIPLLIAGAAIPQELLTIYRNDSPETKIAMRGFWQSLHVYGRGWFVAEPLDEFCDYYKCRFSSSKDYIFDPVQSFFYLLPAEEVLHIVAAPVQPIEWETITDEYDNEYPTNIAGNNGTSRHPEPIRVETSTTSLEEHKERVAVEPIDSFLEVIPFEAIELATHLLLPGNQEGCLPSKRDLPLILLEAAHIVTTAKKREETNDHFERRWLQQRAEDLSAMLTYRKIWWRDRQNFIEIAPASIDLLERGRVCQVHIGIHPAVREKRLRDLRVALKERVS